MTDKIKDTGVTGRLLHQLADRGGSMVTDRRGFPPSKVMLPLKRRGLVEMIRSKASHRSADRAACRYNIWHLTEKAWQRISRTKPVEESE